MKRIEAKEFGAFDEHVKVAVEAASKASRLIRNNQNLKAVSEGLELKADIDSLVDDMIIAKLKSHFPFDEIVTEEIVKKKGFPKDPSRLWLVDPIDGTTNYLSGSDHYACLISYLNMGIPKVSVSYIPGIGVMMAATNHGVFMGNEKVEKPTFIRPLKHSTIAFDPGYDREAPKKVFGLERKLRPYVGNTAKFNSNGWTLSRIAMGKLPALIHFSSKIWEVAGIHMVQESGGTVTDLNGNPLPLKLSEEAFPFVASRGINHQELLDLINS